MTFNLIFQDGISSPVFYDFEVTKWHLKIQRLKVFEVTNRDLKRQYYSF